MNNIGDTILTITCTLLIVLMVLLIAYIASYRMLRYYGRVKYLKSLGFEKYVCIKSKYRPPIPYYVKHKTHQWVKDEDIRRMKENFFYLRYNIKLDDESHWYCKLWSIL